MIVGQIISVIFLVVLLALIVRGVRGHPRTRGGGVTLDGTGNDVGHGIERMCKQLDTIDIRGSGSGSGGD